MAELGRDSSLIMPSRSSVHECPPEEKDILQLGNGGMDDPSGGAAAPLDYPASLFFEVNLSEI